MVRATLDGIVIAESEETKKVEGNHYFPRSALKEECFVESLKTTHCGWKGAASYLHVSVNGTKHENLAWFYPEPLDAAKEIEGHVAFYSKVKITEG